MRQLVRAVMLLACGLGMLVVGCASKEVYSAKISYCLNPSQELPAGLHSLAILDDGVKVDMGDDDARAKKWAKICADMMEQMVQNAKQKYGAELTLAKRRETTKVMAEQDMKMSGMAAGGAAAQGAKLAEVQALITSQLNIRIETQKSTKTTFDVTNLYGGGGHGWGYGGGSITPREAEAISRNITLQCKFSMVDASNGNSHFEYAPKPFRKHDSKKPSPVFGRSSGEADLDPVDMYIGELVEQGTREFVSMFVPTDVEYGYDIESGSSKASAAGVAAMRADNYEGAMSNFKAAVQEKPDDHKSVFAMGVTCELMGDPEGALKYYRQAASMTGVDEKDMASYLAAKERIAAHKDRIRKAKKS